MKFSDLHDPAAAAKAIKEFQRRFSSKVCLAPTIDCKGSIVAAHTLSVEGMLRPISRNGHVYAIEADLFNPQNGRPTRLALKGLRDTSVFNGFCAHHDKALFAPIEDEPFACSQKQLFIHAYRAAAKESYLKRKQAENWAPLLEDMKKIHGWDDSAEYSPEALVIQAASLRGAEEIERHKKLMDKYYVESSWSRVMTTVIPFRKIPTIVCNFLCTPAFDFKGVYLQDFQDLTKDLSQLMVTIIPHQGGGYAFLSHLDTANGAPRNFIKSLVDTPDITSSLVCLVAYHAENFAISPVWYESLSSEETDRFLDSYHINADPFASKVTYIGDCRIAVESWEPGKPFTI